MSEVEEFTEYAPVAQSGEIWSPRTLEQATLDLMAYPAGGAFSDGQEWDGLTHIVSRTVRIERSEWALEPRRTTWDRLGAMASNGTT